jgi:hypothetical protein
MKIEFIASVIALTICTCSAIFGIYQYNVQRDASMKSNIESAIVKGIDPIAVKCAYGSSDPVCVVYAANRK